MLWQPFTNGTAALFWQERNCYVCSRRSRCASARALEACRSFTERNVEICRATRSVQTTGNFCHLPERCGSFNKPAERRNLPVEKMKNGLFSSGRIGIIIDESRGFSGDGAGPTGK